MFNNAHQRSRPLVIPASGNKKDRPQAARFAAAVDKTALSCLVRGSWIRRWLSATPRQTPVGVPGLTVSV